uniref:aurora kinase A-interacting protein n=1 Tax=Scatophagus argus TaxID=75038 RepID=UPI001ED815F1|nr:aurora kinase A-interacting protein [Scatophagus argus]XP_046253284.1 aurora kinase A-interacting protein [Scatophagus argus]
MFTSKVIPRLSLLHRVSCSLQAHAETLHGWVKPAVPPYCSSLKQKWRNYSTAADNRFPPQWVQLEPELDEALVPRKLSVTPLESWLSLRYSLPPLLESAQPLEDVVLMEEKVLPPISVPVIEDGKGSATPLRCKNVLEIRRRMINKHKYKKLQKRTKFMRKKVLDGRRKRKQKRFEEDLKRICARAGLKKVPEGWSIPKIFRKQHGSSTE